MRATQTAPVVLTGLLADLPNPAETPQGYLFFATDTVQLFMLTIDPVTQVRSWDVTSGSSSATGSIYRTYTFNPDPEPDEPAFPGSYTTWEALYAAYSQGTGPSTIYVHDNMPIPAGTYFIRNFTQFEGVANVATAAIFADGASFVTGSSFQFQRVSIISNSNDPVLVLNPDIDQSVQAIIMDQGANIIQNMGGPVLRWTEPSGAGAFLIVAMLLGAQLQNPGLGVDGVIRIEGSGADNPTVLFFLGETSTIGFNTVSSNADATAILQAAVQTSVVEAQPNYLGTGTPFINPFITQGINADVNGFRTFNLGAPQAANDAARAGDVTWSPVDTHNATNAPGDFTIANSFQTGIFGPTMTGIRAKVPIAGTYRCKLWKYDGTLLATAPDEVAAGAKEIDVLFPVAVVLDKAERYLVSIYDTGATSYIGSTLLGGNVELVGDIVVPGGTKSLAVPCGGISWVYPQQFAAGDGAPTTADFTTALLIAIEPLFL